MDRFVIMESQLIKVEGKFECKTFNCDKNQISLKKLH